jgi:hypothetical protein
LAARVRVSKGMHAATSRVPASLSPLK